MKHALLALLLLATPAFANGTTDDTAQDTKTNIYGEPQAQSEGVPRECDVCTARHKSLQRLQQKRLSLPDDEADTEDDG